MRGGTSVSEEMMPREKALEFGITSLNNNELLALVIKTAYRDVTVFELSEEVFDKAKSSFHHFRFRSLHS